MNTLPPVFILAAGFGSRLKPFTNHSPKALVELNGIPLLEHQIKNFQKQGFNTFIVNIHHFGEQILAFLYAHQNFGAHITISDERERLLNTGGALIKALPLINSSPEVLVHNVDVLTNMNYLNFLGNFNLIQADALLAVRNRTTERNFLFDQNFQLRGWKNNTTKESKGEQNSIFKAMAFSGIHLIKTSSINDFRQSSSVFSVIDAYLNLMSTHKIFAYPHDNDLWLDLGKPEQLAMGNVLVKNI